MRTDAKFSKIRRTSNSFGGRINTRSAALAVLLASLALGGCMKASSLGQEAPAHVVITGTPTWSNGIEQLVSLKCAICHQVPRLALSPQNVPADLDLRFEKSFGAIRAAEDVAAQISLGVLQHSLVYDNGTYVNTGVNVTIRQMPLNFATPLYTDEIAALQTWANSVITAETAIPPTSPVLSGANPMTAADGELLYKRNCQSCHGAYGAGGPVQWSLQGSVRGYTGSQLANIILSPTFPMNTWPALVTFANLCTPAGAPTTCNGTQLDAIAAFLAQF
jgi:mono/diheme cytochrome c family protein